MEFVVALFPSLVVMFMVIKLLNKKSRCNSYSLVNQIPGPRKLPLIGNLHLLAGDSRLHRVFTDLSIKYGPLFRVQLGEIPFLIVSSVEVAEQVLKTHDHIFANRCTFGFTSKAMTYNCTDIALSPYGEYWRQLRKICTLELLSMRRVKSFRPIREEENLNLCKWIASCEGSPANISQRIYLSSFDITTRASVGDKTEDQESVTSAIKEFMKMNSGFTLADLYPSIKFLPLISGIKAKIERIFWRMDTTFERIINQHRVANATKMNNDCTGTSEDLADVLLKYQQDGAEMSLTTDNIKAVLMDMFVAGGETSAAVVDWAMSEMMKHPATLRLVIKETMRLHPPLPLIIPRESSRRCEINVYELPAKTKVIINAWALGRDPKYWNDADKFIPERFLDSSIDYKGNNIEYIPFGAGRRICPGMSFGMANVEFTLAMLLYHFDWGMPNGTKNEELDMADGEGLT